MKRAFIIFIILLAVSIMVYPIIFVVAAQTYGLDSPKAFYSFINFQNFVLKSSVKGLNVVNKGWIDVRIKLTQGTIVSLYNTGDFTLREEFTLLEPSVGIMNDGGWFSVKDVALTDAYMASLAGCLGEIEKEAYYTKMKVDLGYGDIKESNKKCIRVNQNNKKL